jgi:ligand-binding SRPBCC domain-containing protein
VTRFALETEIAAPIDHVFDLARDIGLHAASMSASGEHAIAGRMRGPIEAGETVTWRARHFGIWWTLTSRITVVERPSRFADEQVAGPFRRFSHVHAFLAVPGGTLMTDDWDHTPPFGPLGWLADRLFLGRYMHRLLEARNAFLKAEAERPQVTGSGIHGPSAVATATNSGSPSSMSTSQEAIRSVPPGAANV